MQIITVSNEKGGTGKTTLSITLAAGLAILGKRVLLIDADPQGHATLSLGINKAAGLYNLLVRDEEWSNALVSVPRSTWEPNHSYTEPPRFEAASTFYLLPGNAETINIAHLISDPFSVGDRLHELDRAFDYVIVDTSPTPSLLNGIIALITDAIFYPTPCESLAFDGLAESLHHRDQATFQRAKYGYAGVKTLGIIPTLYRASTLEHRENLEDLRTQLGDLVWDPIPLRTIWPEAARVRKSIFAFAPSSEAAEDAWKFVQNVTEALHVEQR